MQVVELLLSHVLQKGSRAEMQLAVLRRSIIKLLYFLDRKWPSPRLGKLMLTFHPILSIIKRIQLQAHIRRIFYGASHLRQRT